MCQAKREPHTTFWLSLTHHKKFCKVGDGLNPLNFCTFNIIFFGDLHPILLIFFLCTLTSKFSHKIMKPLFLNEYWTFTNIVLLKFPYYLYFNFVLIILFGKVVYYFTKSRVKKKIFFKKIECKSQKKNYIRDENHTRLMNQCHTYRILKKKNLI